MLSWIRAKVGGGSKNPGFREYFLYITSAEETWSPGLPLKSSFPKQTHCCGWNTSFTELSSKSPASSVTPGCHHTDILFLHSDSCHFSTYWRTDCCQSCDRVPGLPACGHSQQPGDITMAQIYIRLPKNTQREKGTIPGKSSSPWLTLNQVYQPSNISFSLHMKHCSLTQLCHGAVRKKRRQRCSFCIVNHCFESAVQALTN